MTLYKNPSVLKKGMTSEQLDEILGEMKLCDMLDDMRINEGRQEEQQEARKIEEMGKELDGVD
jgi:hypothetical protein